MKIVIETIPYDQMSYPTVGDYYWSHNGTLVIQVADLGDERMNYLVALHELEEVMRCKHRGITLKEIEDWDLAFEHARSNGEVPDDAEPGAAKGCPYRCEHLEAEVTERRAALDLGVDWEEYEAAIEGLEWPADRPIDNRHAR